MRWLDDADADVAESFDADGWWKYLGGWLAWDRLRCWWLADSGGRWWRSVPPSRPTVTPGAMGGRLHLWNPTMTTQVADCYFNPLESHVYIVPTKCVHRTVYIVPKVTRRHGYQRSLDG